MEEKTRCLFRTVMDLFEVDAYLIELRNERSTGCQTSNRKAHTRRQLPNAVAQKVQPKSRRTAVWNTGKSMNKNIHQQNQFKQCIF